MEAIGPSILSYAWKKDGEVITCAMFPNCTGLDTNTLTISSITPLYEGDYVCSITNEDGLSVESEAVKVRGKRKFLK